MVWHKHSEYWIFSPVRDLAFVMLTPVPIVLGFFAAQRAGWTNGLVAFILVLAMGHYLPGILRAYGDSVLFRRFRLRLIVAPVFIVGVTTSLAYLNLNFVFLLLGLWGAWHWVMQIYGFSRIYEAKGSPSSWNTARLDQIFCILWFGMCVFVLNDTFPLYVARFYKSGGSLLPAGAFVWLTRSWIVVTAVVTAVYAIDAIRKTVAGQKPNPLKFLFIGATFIYLAYTASLIEQPMVAYGLFESWHDIQYLSLVWFFNIGRARKNPEAGSLIRFLFRPTAARLLAYVALCLAFGSLTHAWKLFEQPTFIRIVASIVPAMAFLHYYLDGFIWKIRETDTRQILVGTAGRAADPVRQVSLWNQHALLWALFIVAGALLMVMESGSSVAQPIQVYENLVATFPQSPNAHFELGRELVAAGRLTEAKVELERSLALGPQRSDAHNSLGIVLAGEQDLAGAAVHFERALNLDPGNAELHNNLGTVFAALGDVDLARVHQERATEIDPHFADAHYRLGLTLVKTGEVASAIDHFEQALRNDPNHVRAMNDLGVVLAREGKLSEARDRFQEALRIKPDYASAEQNLQKVTAQLAEERRDR